MKSEKRTIGCLVLIAVLLAFVHQAVAGDERPEADLSVSILSQYIWRGQELSRDSVVFQPSLTFAYKGVSANVWMNFDSDPFDNSMDNLNETDLTLSYSHSFGLVDAEVGYIYYALSGIDDSQEFYLSGTLNTFLSPSLTVYQEFAHYNSTYIVFGVSHSLALSRGISLDVGLQGSYLASQDEGAYPDPDDSDDKYSNFHDGMLSVAVPIPFTAFCDASEAQFFTVTPEIYWVFPMSGDASRDMSGRSMNGSGKNNFVYGGLTLSMSF
jgi:hypothetical protein